MVDCADLLLNGPSYAFFFATLAARFCFTVFAGFFLTAFF
jgi:hypothetical protein